MAMTSRRRAAFTAVALIAVAALLVRRVAQPPAPVPASAPASEFSAERAIAHVRQIAQAPHPVGSADNARARAYIVAQLQAMGLETQVQEATGVGTRYPTAGRIRNVIARLPGRTPGGPSVVLMSHYDGVAGGPAAGDAGAGTAAILETIRALRAGPPLAHDVIALITDGEEAGLLGAAAFVREHPWARDVGVTLNFEARGTRGRSQMFETGPGNLDVVRALRTAGNVAATSLSVTVYRSLPNDTDLSEMALLGKPALNFAFTDGVERYHTAHDDVAHLDPRSVQHHGSQMLALARTFGNGSLPRPVTGDAVFFDVPLFGLVLYPERWAWPIAIAAIALALAATIRVARRERGWIRDVVLGSTMTLVTAAIAGGLAMVFGNAIGRAHEATGWHGAPGFRGIYTAALVALALTVVFAGWALARRWASAAGAHIGALIVWTVAALLVTWKLPGVSFLVVWPLIAVALATIVAAGGPVATGAGLTPGIAATVSLWIATLVAMAIVVPIAYAVSAVLLGADGPGGIAAGVLVALVAWLVAPHLETMSAGRPWVTTGLVLTLALGLTAIGMATVRSSPEHPTPSRLVYALDATGSDAWLAVRGLSATQVGAPSTPAAQPPAWIARLIGGGLGTLRRVTRLPVDGPSAEVIADSTVGAERTVVLRIRAAPGTEAISMRTVDHPVLRTSIDGRPIDTSRYRGGVRAWRLEYAAPPDSGVTLALTVPAATALSLELAARARGIPSLPDVQLPTRAPDVVTVQTGDITVVRSSVVIPSAR